MKSSFEANENTTIYFSGDEWKQNYEYRACLHVWFLVASFAERALFLGDTSVSLFLDQCKSHSKSNLIVATVIWAHHLIAITSYEKLHVQKFSFTILFSQSYQ